MVGIGQDSAERLDVISAQFRVIVTRRPKLACRACVGVVVQQPAPARLVEGGLPTEATVAHVLVSRYADHLPLYLQAQIMARQGVLVDRATLAGWAGMGAAEIAPVAARLKAILLGRPGRSRTRPRCRQFYDLALKAKAPVAQEVLRRIAALYAIEAELRGSPPERRLAERHARSRPLAEDLFTWLENTLAKLPTRGDTAEAIRYCLHHRAGLLRFLEDGRIDLDTNSVERAARPVALSRKNALFAGSDDGASHWAAIASLIETCKLNGVDPQRYLKDLLTRLVQGWPQARIDELMPWCWADTARSSSGTSP